MSIQKSFNSTIFIRKVIRINAVRTKVIGRNVVRTKVTRTYAVRKKSLEQMF